MHLNKLAQLVFVLPASSTLPSKEKLQRMCLLSLLLSKFVVVAHDKELCYPPFGYYTGMTEHVKASDDPVMKNDWLGSVRLSISTEGLPSRGLKTTAGPNASPSNSN